jgi:hypothetical protein
VGTPRPLADRPHHEAPLIPLLIVFAAGAALTAVLVALGPAVASALAAGIVIGFLIRPLLIGILENW